MEVIIIGLLLWFVGDVISQIGTASKSVVEYWEIRERERIAREYGDDCE